MFSVGQLLYVIGRITTSNKIYQLRLLKAEDFGKLN
jgi:hypothetical protein